MSLRNLNDELLARDGHEVCGFSMEYYHINMFEMSEEISIAGYHPPCTKNPDGCTDCGFLKILRPEFATCFPHKKEGSSPRIQ